MKNLGALLLALLPVLTLATILPACKSGGDATAESAGPNDGSRVLDKEAFAAAIKRANAVVVDLRAPFEFEQAHIEKAINVYFFDPEFKYKILELRKGKKYYLYGKNEVTAHRAMEFMNKNEYPEVFILKEGWEGWNTARADPK